MISEKGTKMLPPEGTVAICHPIGMMKCNDKWIPLKETNVPVRDARCSVNEVEKYLREHFGQTCQFKFSDKWLNSRSHKRMSS